MRLKTKKIKLISIVILFIFSSCNNETTPYNTDEDTGSKPLTNELINFDHFNHLYKEITLNNTNVGIIHIYSEYPNYTYAIEPSEGFTCVDDVSRAIIMLSNYVEVFGNNEIASEKIKNLTEFILQMQNQNGYFNNFLWNDFSINTTYQTSVAEMNWWSFRALWALETAYPHLIKDTEMTDRIRLAIEKISRQY